jgi:SWI/SNF-related matrix-associated actin-dependent regulator 1 of chromatin subfamily A
VQILNVPDKLYKEYYKIEQDVIEFLAQKAREIAIEEDADPDEAYWDKVVQLQFSEHLVKLTVLRDAVSKIKYQAITEWLDEFLANGEEKVVVFAEHINLVEMLSEKYGNLAVKVRGGVSNDDRMAAVDRFQTDPTCRMFIGNMKAASEGLTLTAASDVVFCELAWTPAIHEQCVGRCYGRVNDLHGATAWYLLAERTIDEDIFELLEEKKVIIDAVTNGIDPDVERSVMMSLMMKLTKRGLKDERHV